MNTNSLTIMNSPFNCTEIDAGILPISGGYLVSRSRPLSLPPFLYTDIINSNGGEKAVDYARLVDSLVE